MTKEIDGTVDDFRTRPLGAGLPHGACEGEACGDKRDGLDGRLLVGYSPVAVAEDVDIVRCVAVVEPKFAGGTTHTDASVESVSQCLLAGVGQ